MKGYWKVPFRQVFCPTFIGMVKQAIWCHIVIALFPNVVDFDFAPLDRREFVQQYEFMFRRAEWTRVLNDEKASPAAKIGAYIALESMTTPPLSAAPGAQAYQVL